MTAVALSDPEDHTAHGGKVAKKRRAVVAQERADVAACLHSWNDDEWDEQMKRDVASGKFDRIVAQVDADIAANKLRDMP